MQSHAVQPQALPSGLSTSTTANGGRSSSKMQSQARIQRDLRSTAVQLWDNQEEYKRVLQRKYTEAQK